MAIEEAGGVGDGVAACTPPPFALIVRHRQEVAEVEELHEGSVVVKQEAFDEQNVGLFGGRLCRVGRDVHPMGTGELDWVLHPGTHRAHHGLHIQRVQHIPLLKAVLPDFYLILRLEEVVLVDDAAVGQRLDDPVGQRGFASVGDASDPYDVLHGGAVQCGEEEEERAGEGSAGQRPRAEGGVAAAAGCCEEAPRPPCAAGRSPERAGGRRRRSRRPSCAEPGGGEAGGSAAGEAMAAGA